MNQGGNSFLGYEFQDNFSIFQGQISGVIINLRIEMHRKSDIL